MGDAVYRWFAQSGQAFHFLLKTTSGLIGAGPEKYVRLIKALLEAEQYAEEYPEEVKNFLAKRFGLSPDIAYVASRDLQEPLGMISSCFSKPY